MADIVAVRAELKTWERTFKAQNGREPSVHDIKAHPTIAERYKLYKRLSKFAAASPSAARAAAGSIDTPSTPPRTRGRAEAGPSHAVHAIIQKPRAVPTEAPVESSNPFSPSKRTHRPSGHTPFFPRRTSPQHTSLGVPSSSKLAQLRSGSPNPFSDDTSLGDDTVLPSLAVPPPNYSQTVLPEVARARKRLRGEAVSPSPQKDKRRRVISQAIAPFPRFELDEEDGAIDDSPVKPSRYGTDQSFASLFNEEALPSPDFTGRGASRIRRSLSTSSDARSVDARSVADDPPTSDHEDSLDSGLPHVSSARLSRQPSKALKAKKAVGPRAYASDDLHKPKGDGTTLGPTEITSGKSDRVPAAPASQSGALLLPPSPSATKGSRPKYGGGDRRADKSSAVNSKQKLPKKANFPSSTASHEDEDGASSDLEDDPHVRVYDWNASRRALLAVDDPTSDFDPEFDFALARPQRLVVNPPFEDDADEGALQVDVPDHLKSVLALPADRPAPTSANGTDPDDIGVQPRAADDRSKRRQQALVQAVISGNRFGHYDSARGGEIWDAGEYSEGDAVGADDPTGAAGALMDDDDWEGEGMPWEAGEL